MSLTGGKVPADILRKTLDNMMTEGMICARPLTLFPSASAPSRGPLGYDVGNGNTRCCLRLDSRLSFARPAVTTVDESHFKSTNQ